MAETTPVIFGKNLVDLTGLEQFWGAVKTYIGNADTALSNRITELANGQVTTNKNNIATINEKLTALGTGSTDGSIKTAIETAVNDLANGQVTTNKNNIAALRTDVDSLTEGFDTNVNDKINAKLEPVIEQVNTNKGDISTIKGQLTALGTGSTEGSIKTAITTAVSNLETTKVDKNTTDIAGLKETVAGHTNTLASHTESINGMPAVMDGKINTFKAGLTHTNSGAAGTGKYVSKVEQANGVVAVTYATLPDPTEEINAMGSSTLASAKTYTDEEIAKVNKTITDNESVVAAALADLDSRADALEAYDAVLDGKIAEGDNKTLTDAKKYTDEQLAAHTAVEDTYKTDTVDKTGKIHVSAQDRYNWDVAATRIDTFLNSVTDNSVIDTLTEINNWFTQHGGNYDTLLGVVNGHTNSIASNLEKINTINAGLATITIATTDACAAIVK